MQRFCILRHMREIKENYIKDREKFNKLVGSPHTLVCSSQQCHLCQTHIAVLASPTF